MGNFGRNGKPLALLFGEKWLFLGVFAVVLKVEESCKWAILGEMVSPSPYFLAKNGCFWVPFQSC